MSGRIGIPWRALVPLSKHLFFIATTNDTLLQFGLPPIQVQNGLLLILLESKYLPVPWNIRLKSYIHEGSVRRTANELKEFEPILVDVRHPRQGCDGESNPRTTKLQYRITSQVITVFKSPSSHTISFLLDPHRDKEQRDALGSATCL